MVEAVIKLVRLVFGLNLLWKIGLKGQACAMVLDHLSLHVAKGGRSWE